MLFLSILLAYLKIVWVSIGIIRILVLIEIPELEVVVLSVYGM